MKASSAEPSASGKRCSGGDFMLKNEAVAGQSGLNLYYKMAHTIFYKAQMCLRRKGNVEVGRRGVPTFGA